MGIRQERRFDSEDEVGDDVQRKPIRHPRQIDRRAPFANGALRIIVASSRIQNINEDIDVTQNSILKLFEILPAKKLRMSLPLKPHQPVLSTGDKIRCAPTDAQSCVFLVLGHVCADAVDVGVRARVVERERVGGNPYYWSCEPMSVDMWLWWLIGSCEDTISLVPFVRLFVQVTSGDEERRVP